MRIVNLHSWKVTHQEARAIQERLKGEVITRDELATVHFIAGVDVGFECNGKVTRAAVAVLSFPEMILHEHAIARCPTQFPYVPGLLSFRETPAVLEALHKLNQPPDLILCDGHGLAHPRRFGLACHIGLLCSIPSIGVAKTRLAGVHAPVGPERGAWQSLTEDGEVIGAVLRTRAGVKPVYVSIGHRVSLATAIDFVLRCSPRYRLPETTRLAHRLASQKP